LIGLQVPGFIDQYAKRIDTIAETGRLKGDTEDAQWLRMERELAALKTDVWHRVAHIAVSGDREVIVQTWNGYEPVVVLSRDALLVGGAGAALCWVLFEMLMLSLRISRVGGATKSHINTNKRREDFIKKYVTKK
jgi:hypothetical protein